MDWIPLSSDILTQRHHIALIALLLHGLFHGGLIALHRFSPFTIPARLRTLWLHQVISPWVFRAEDKLNRADRTPTKRAWRGGAVLAAVLVASWVLASGATLIFLHALPSYYLVAILLASLLPIGPQMLQAYLAFCTSQPTQLPQGSYPAMTLLDQPHLRRVRLERLGRSIVETLAILCGFVVAELHGAIAMSMLCLLYHSVIVPTSRYQPYGVLIRVLYEILCFLPAFVAALLTLLAGMVTPHTSPFAALRALFSASQTTQKKEALPPPYPTFFFRIYAAMFSASIGGPYHCDNTTIHAPWIGEGTAHLIARHVLTALWHSGAVLFLSALAMSTVV